VLSADWRSEPALPVPSKAEGNVVKGTDSIAWPLYLRNTSGINRSESQKNLAVTVAR